MSRSGAKPKTSTTGDRKLTCLRLTTVELRQVDALVKRTGIRTRSGILLHALARLYAQEFHGVRDPSTRT